MWVSERAVENWRRLALALGMSVDGIDLVDANLPAGVVYRGNLGALVDAAASADFVSLHLPLNDLTRGLVDAQVLGAMPAGAILINVARGGLVDERALIDALVSQRLGGAGLDVVETEPLAAESRLRTMPNVVITPHVAGMTDGSRLRRAEFVVANVCRFLEGDRPLELVSHDSASEGARR